MAFKKAKREQENSVISKGNSVSPDGRRTTRSRRQKRIAKHASDGFFLISCFVFMFHFHFFFVFVSFRVLFRSGGFRSISFFFPIGSPSFFLFIFFLASRFDSLGSTSCCCCWCCCLRRHFYGGNHRSRSIISATSCVFCFFFAKNDRLLFSSVPRRRRDRRTRRNLDGRSKQNKKKQKKKMENH